MEATIAIAGNPNSGKSSLFNTLTGARQHVGNYPGVTVEKKSGQHTFKECRFNIVDLPGTYSLTAYSLEELVARDFLINAGPSLVIDVVDAANLERNLYLAIQFMEIGIPVCIALNMMDVAEKRGIRVDVRKLSELLGVPVTATVARNGQGKEALMESARDLIRRQPPRPPFIISYGNDVDPVLEALTAKIQAAGLMTASYPPRWTALKFLERDEQVLKQARQADPTLSAEIEKQVDRLSVHLQETLNTYPELVIADYRYGFIKSLLKQGVVSFQGDPDRLFLSDKIDKIVTQRFIGPIIMAAVIYGLYYLTFTVSKTPVEWLEGFFKWLGVLTASHLSEGFLKSLIVSGIIDGVGSVLGFVPLVMFMFFGIALLDDSGYLARMAFMLDRVFRAFGLHGGSLMAFIVSGGIAGGCAVPGVMATRTLKSPRERLATLLTVPFMNCGAKLPVYALLVGAFFSQHEALMMALITVLAWIGALSAAKFLRVTLIKGAGMPFVMELPPYRVPTFKGLFLHTWERTVQYIKKAGTIILSISILLWAMMTFPQMPAAEKETFAQKKAALLAAAPAHVALELENSEEPTGISSEASELKDQIATLDAEQAEEALRHSIAGRIGAALEPISAFAGFDWRTNIALVAGFAAKEVVVSTLGTAYSLGEVDPEESGPLSEKLAETPGWRPLAALSLIVFTMFYAPCFASVVCICRESGSWKWGAFSMMFNTLLAFSLAVFVFQLGSALGF
ncbi:MAG: ferrous iron transport protein B [Deltaproteobacteria bacterium]|nr:ferrous iron transport protein B [Deltaproteobacteria bacterium]